MPDPLTSIAAALADRYRIERELGAGGMATVYLAQDLKHDRKVAVKVLRPELAAVIGADRFVSEIRTTANLQHPHILPLFDSGAAGAFLFYVMPYVEGISLRDRMFREKQLPVAEAVRIASEIAAALDYAHRHGVIHRDIKPENILLHDGSALVADFGIALAASTAGTRMTETGMSLGTPQYMSPEQAMGERELDARSDVYALGCVTYEMLTGEPPFSGPTAQAIVAKVMTAEPAEVTTLRRTVPGHVADAVHTALQKLPADRFESARAFAEALTGSVVTTRRPPGSRPLPRRATSSRGLLYALLAINALLLALAVFGWLRPGPAAGVTRQQVVLWQHSLRDFLAPGVAQLATQAAIAPDGSSIVFTDSTVTGRQLWRKRRYDSRAMPMAGTEGGVSPFFSPDGKWIGYITSDGRLRKVPVDGGGSIVVTPEANPIYATAAWLDDGTIIFVGFRDSGLRRVSADGGASQRIGADTISARFARFDGASVAALPGSRGFLYTACPGNCGLSSSIFVFDFAADSGRLLVADAAGAWYSSTGHLLYTDRSGGLYAAGFDARSLQLTSGVVPVIEGVIPGSFAISASGSVLYTVSAGPGMRSELVWVSRDGRSESVDAGWRANFEYPALSPDGKSLAVSVSDGLTQLWIRRADGTRQKLTSSGTVNWRPAWAPDGRSVAFVSNIRGGKGMDDFDIYQARVDGRAPAELLLHHTYGLWEAEFSPDGNWLVVRSDELVNDGNIRGRSIRGDTALIPLVVDEAVSTQIAISPDGRWLAYASDASGRYEIYLTPFPAATSTHLVSRNGGTEPRWAHSGRELFFKGGNQLMVVDITAGPAFGAGTPRPLFSLAGYRSARNRQQYDVAPDDRRFVMIREPTDVPAGDVMLVEHWFEDLETIMMRAQQ